MNIFHKKISCRIKEKNLFYVYRSREHVISDISKIQMNKWIMIDSLKLKRQRLKDYLSLGFLVCLKLNYMYMFLKAILP